MSSAIVAQEGRRIIYLEEIAAREMYALLRYQSSIAAEISQHLFNMGHPNGVKDGKEKYKLEKLRIKLLKKCKKITKSYCKKSYNMTDCVCLDHTEEPDSHCVICIDKYSGQPLDQVIGVLNQCGHYYHIDCLWRWLKECKSCPVCRTNVKICEEDIKAVPYLQILLAQVSLDDKCLQDKWKDIAKSGKAKVIDDINEDVEEDNDNEIITNAQPVAAQNENTQHQQQQQTVTDQKITYCRLGIRSLLSGMKMFESTTIVNGVMLTMPQKYTPYA